MAGTVYVDHLPPTTRDQTLTESAATRDSVLTRRLTRQQLLDK
ncbi:hypothetical protein [Kribbella sp. HUAS MG21]|uniref:Uncharacterized protein n=1 Tax=Kribbella sp. HUAS MG21 TaxID=3160966 RepID=A0AAU7TA79_9ACTN